jgi:hypothetical protein
LQLLSGKEDIAIEAETSPAAAQLVHCGAHHRDGQAIGLRLPLAAIVGLGRGGKNEAGHGVFGEL